MDVGSLVATDAIERNGFDDENTGEVELDAYTGPQLAALIRRQSTRPWVTLRFDANASELVRVPAGACITLTAGTGAGKSSLAIQVLTAHSEAGHPGVYASWELSAEEVGARIVSQRCGVSWEDALRCEVDAHEFDRALSLPTLRVLDQDTVSLDRLEATIIAVRRPDATTLVVVDYVQVVEYDGPSETRQRIARVVESLRRMAKRLGCVMLILSQPSRDTARKLENGSLQGDATTDAGAETAQIERAAHTTLALGDKEKLDEDRCALGLSVGKGRMGGGDRVIPVVFDGKTGVFKIAGDTVSGTAARAARSSVADKVVEHVALHPGEFKTRKEIIKSAGCRLQAGFAAIRAELAPGGRLEHRGKRFYVRTARVPGSGSLRVASAPRS